MIQFAGHGVAIPIKRFWMTSKRWSTVIPFSNRVRMSSTLNRRRRRLQQVSCTVSTKASCIAITPTLPRIV